MIASLPEFLFAGTEELMVRVRGTSNPWLAGMASGTIASPGNVEGPDVATNQSPVLIRGYPVVPGASLSFRVDGGVAHDPVIPTDPPDGGAEVTSHVAGAEHGKSDISAPFNALLGVFLDDLEPGASSVPTSLDFSSNESRNFTNLAPVLRQMFFIGDGKTSEGISQQFVVPAGATRLFLGTMDSYGWANNGGELNVAIGNAAQPASARIFLYAAIEISGTVGQNYRIEYADSINPVTWHGFTNILLPTNPYLVFDQTGPVNGRRFYRVLPAP